ncbi:hypothetical protein LSAT2_000670, partial [Lamellibrachia satsuma]
LLVPRSSWKSGSRQTPLHTSVSGIKTTGSGVHLTRTTGIKTTGSGVHLTRTTGIKTTGSGVHLTRTTGIKTTVTSYAVDKLQATVDMDSRNTSNWTNASSVVQNILNDTFDSDTNQPKHTEDVPIVVVFLCLLGLPGNVLVMTVYVRKKTTSTRLYMFALAVADSAVCVGGIVLGTALTVSVTTKAIIYVINMSVLYSMLLLVSVSIERLIAV